MDGMLHAVWQTVKCSPILRWVTCLLCCYFAWVQHTASSGMEDQECICWATLMMTWCHKWKQQNAKRTLWSTMARKTFPLWGGDLRKARMARDSRWHKTTVDWTWVLPVSSWKGQHEKWKVKLIVNKVVDDLCTNSGVVFSSNKAFYVAELDIKTDDSDNVEVLVETIKCIKSCSHSSKDGKTVFIVDPNDGERIDHVSISECHVGLFCFPRADEIFWRRMQKGAKSRRHDWAKLQIRVKPSVKSSCGATESLADIYLRKLSWWKGYIKKMREEVFLRLWQSREEPLHVFQMHVFSTEVQIWRFCRSSCPESWFGRDHSEMS